MSRKQKAYRAWCHKAKVEDMNVQRAFAAGWDAHKGIAHARTIQELQAENQRLREDAERYRFIRGYQVSVLDFYSDGRCVWIVNAESFDQLDWAIDAAIDAAKE